MAQPDGVAQLVAHGEFTPLGPVVARAIVEEAVVHLRVGAHHLVPARPDLRLAGPSHRLPIFRRADENLIAVGVALGRILVERLAEIAHRQRRARIVVPLGEGVAAPRQVDGHPFGLACRRETVAQVERGALTARPPMQVVPLMSGARNGRARQCEQPHRRPTSHPRPAHAPHLPVYRLHKRGQD